MRLLSKLKTGYWLITLNCNTKICSQCKREISKVSNFDYIYCPYCSSQNTIKHSSVYKKGDNIYYTSPGTVDIAKGKVIDISYVNGIINTICIQFDFGHIYSSTFDAKYIDINLFRTLEEAKEARKEWTKNEQ